MSFQKRLLSGEFVVLAEMSTPKGVDISQMVTNARRIKGRVDAVVVPDMDNGVMRMSALAGGVLMQQQGVEAVIHLYGRDRNRMALQGDMLAAYVLGIQNLLVVDSEDMANGDHRDAVVVEDPLDTAGRAGGNRGHLLVRGGRQLVERESSGVPGVHAVEGEGVGMGVEAERRVESLDDGHRSEVSVADAA